MRSDAFTRSDAFALTIPLLVGLGASRLVSPYDRSRNRNKVSPLQPPGWVFAVAWTVLYALQGIAACLAWRASGRRWSPALSASAVLLLALFAWGAVFFNAHLPRASFFAILAIAGGALATAALYLAEGRALSACLSLPLVAWLAFASVLIPIDGFSFKAHAAAIPHI